MADEWNEINKTPGAFVAYDEFLYRQAAQRVVEKYLSLENPTVREIVIDDVEKIIRVALTDRLQYFPAADSQTAAPAEPARPPRP